MGGTVILLIILAVVVLYGVSAYNGLINLKNQTLNAFKQIDVQLKRRHDLIPNLVNAVKGRDGLRAPDARSRDPGPESGGGRRSERAPGRRVP